ncbi:hypothetical protein CH361_17400 [Leptospira brenneri]|nr:hypothetical protein CH361_17400 [Leptospira brenneri]
MVEEIDQTRMIPDLNFMGIEWNLIPMKRMFCKCNGRRIRILPSFFTCSKIPYKTIVSMNPLN